MRKITEEAIKHFYNKTTWIKSNTSVYVIKGAVYLELFGNMIAVMHNNDELQITTAGWNSRTTRERLNGLKGVHVYMSKGQLVLNEKAWDGKLITINQELCM